MVLVIYSQTVVDCSTIMAKKKKGGKQSPTMLSPAAEETTSPEEEGKIAEAETLADSALKMAEEAKKAQEALAAAKISLLGTDGAKADTAVESEELLKNDEALAETPSIDETPSIPAAPTDEVFMKAEEDAAAAEEDAVVRLAKKSEEEAAKKAEEEAAEAAKKAEEEPVMKARDNTATVAKIAGEEAAVVEELTAPATSKLTDEEVVHVGPVEVENKGTEAGFAAEVHPQIKVEKVEAPEPNTTEIEAEKGEEKSEVETIEDVSFPVPTDEAEAVDEGKVAVSVDQVVATTAQAPPQTAKVGPPQKQDVDAAAQSEAAMCGCVIS